MDDIQKEIQNLWREMVSEMNYALSDDCMKEMQARNVLRTRYHKLRLSLQGTIDAIKEFTKTEQLLVGLPPNPFDVENLPQIPSSEATLQATGKPTQHAIKSVSSSHEDFLHQRKDSASFIQRNCSVSLESDSDSFECDSRVHNNDGNSIRDHPDTFITSGSNRSEGRTQFHNTFRYGRIRNSKKMSHASQISGNHHEMYNSSCRSYHSGSSAKDYHCSIVPAHTLTHAALSPAAESKETTEMLSNESEQLHLSNNSSGEDTSIYERQHFVNQMFNGYPDIQYLADDFCRCKSNSSRFSNVVNNSENFPPNKEKKAIHSMENVFKTSEQQRYSGIVVPSPDFSCDSSNDEDELEQRRFPVNSTPHNYGLRQTSVIKLDPSSIYAKRNDLIPHKTPPSKQLTKVKITWVVSQRDFYVTFVNEERKYSLLERSIREQNYKSLIGRKVEEGEPCMVLKNGQFYRALLESSIGNICHVFLVDFGGYLMISRREIAPMLQQHAQLPMAAIHCAILGAFQVELTTEVVDAFKRKFPIDSTFKLLFVRRPKHDDVYETQLYLRENMRHDAFLPLEAYFD